MHAAWVVKHKPKSLSEVVGNKESIHKLVEWVKSWKESVPKKRAALLYGPPGVGKTVTVESMANDLGMLLVEKNASDYRTEEALKRFAGRASQYQPLLGGERIILLDEIDGLHGNVDRGGVKAMTEILKSARCPIILTANDAYDRRFTNIRKYCLLIEFKKPSAGQVFSHLVRISSLEGIQVEERALKLVAQRSGGDVRSAVNDFQALTEGKARLTFDDVSEFGYRDRKESIFTVLKMIVHGKTCLSAKRAVNMADVDIDMLFEWIYENAPAHLSDPYDLDRAMNALSLADVYRGRIRSTQNWGLLRYVIDYMTAGVAMAKQNTKTTGWIPFRFPGRIQMMGRTRSERSMKRNIGLKIKRKCHISAARASTEVLPFLKIIFHNDVEMSRGLARWLDLDDEMIEYLAGNKTRAEAIVKSSS